MHICSRRAPEAIVADLMPVIMSLYAFRGGIMCARHDIDQVRSDTQAAQSRRDSTASKPSAPASVLTVQPLNGALGHFHDPQKEKSDANHQAPFSQTQGYDSKQVPRAGDPKSDHGSQ